MSALEAALHYTFTDQGLLEQALTHRSFASVHNERLEFLGDAVLDLVISRMLFDQLHSLPEGDLSRIRANLVCTDHLQKVAHQLGLNKLLKLGAGERKSGGSTRESNLANALEAVIGAIFVDGGYAAAQESIQHIFKDIDLNNVKAIDQRDAKTRLQEWLQARKIQLPSYVVTNTLGAEHQQTFVVSCAIASLKLQSEGQGPSKRAAEQSAARAMLALL